MTSKKIMVRNDGYGMEEVLSLSETMAARFSLNRKKAMHLRLLSEEMMAMLRSIVGDVVAEFWIGETDGMVSLLELHLSSDTRLYKRHMRELIALSSTRKNIANKGVMGKIRGLFAAAFMPENEYAEEMANYMYGSLQADMTSGTMTGSSPMYWSLNKYKDDVQEDLEHSAGQTLPEAEEACDELEKSVIANLAEEVKVGIRGNHVDLIVYMTRN